MEPTPDIADHYSAFKTEKGNVVWIGPMSLAWQDLAKTYGSDQL